MSKEIDIDKHKDLVDNYKQKKSKHLERLATKILKQDEKVQNLKDKKIKGDFLDLF